MAWNQGLVKHGLWRNNRIILAMSTALVLSFMPVNILYADNHDKGMKEQIGQKLTMETFTSEDETIKQGLREEQAEEQTETEKNKVIRLLGLYLDNLNISGGISAGWFDTTEPGAGNKESNFVLSNLLLDISSDIAGGIAGFNMGLGGVATPSVLSSPNEALPVFDIEYAQINLKPVNQILLEAGLLRPNAGYECTYTFNNPNILVGALASQQPYNAAGARFTYIYNEDLKLWAGMYRHRLDDDEYRTDDVYINEYGQPRSLGAQDSSSYELGVNSSIKGVGVNLYHYHLNGLRHLTGIVVDYNELKHIYLALNADYWRWSSNVEGYFKDKSAPGVAMYIVPSVKKLLFPLRLEYIHEGESRIYLDNTDAKAIYAVTFTPTYNLLNNVYIRAEVSYVYANDGFQDNKGNPADRKYNFAIETGIKL
ncbi:MAG: outer membrane beta-barrel protein [bacterium]